MGVSLRANILENMFLYFQTSNEERKLTFTLEEVKTLFKDRYNWKWDSGLDHAFYQLTSERCSRGQPGLLKLPKTETYTWQNGFDPETADSYRTSNFFTASTIKADYEQIVAASWSCDVEQMYEDAKRAFEQVTGKVFEEALVSEDQAEKERMASRRSWDSKEIPF